MTRNTQRFDIHTGVSLTPDLTALFRLRGHGHVTVHIEVKSQSSRGSAIEKIPDRVNRLMLHRIHNAVPVIMVLSMSEQNPAQLRTFEQLARQNGVGYLYAEQCDERTFLKVVREQLRLIELQRVARRKLVAWRAGRGGLSGTLHHPGHCSLCAVVLQLDQADALDITVN